MSSSTVSNLDAHIQQICDSSNLSNKVTEVLNALKEEEAGEAGPKNYAPEITSPKSEGFAKTIDHTLLKPDATKEQVERLCEEARRWGFKSCCVNSSWAKYVTEKLSGSGVETCVVVGFPLGAAATEVKAFETKYSVTTGGAHEIDTVLPVGLLKSRNYPAVFHDIHSVVVAAQGRPVKVILETVLLTQEEKIIASYIAAEAGARFVKTSTGFLGGGATKEDVRLMRKSVEYVEKERGVEKRVMVKASGGVRSFEKCLEMLQAGADRIGTSSGVQIMEAIAPQGEGY